jgi:hypothetical protein
LAGASALLEGALVLATQPARPKAVPLGGAEQLDPGTVVVVVVDVDVTAAAEADGMAGARKQVMVASDATIAAPLTTCPPCRPRP